jgi:benzoyl-CoA reductase/2-hydroxyglutaryl-CoA dehydratase subunit BcrC/BadD/HgdB
MKSIREMASYVTDKRPSELRKLQSSGVAVIGYPPGGYLPEELIYAAGAIPICMFRGGDPEAVAASGVYIPRFIDTFCRSQIGYWDLGEDPYYKLVDLIIFPITDNNERVIADCWDFYTELKVFRFGVPHNNLEKAAFDYYLGGLRLVRQKLEEVTGNKITDDRLREACHLYNRIRKALREISLLRKNDSLPISGKDFLMLNHVSYMMDPELFAAEVERIAKELKQKEGVKKTPRLLFTAGTMAFGDYKVFNLIEETDADIVIEEIPEGMRPYWEDVGLEGDPMVSLAETYLMKRVVPAYFRPSLSRLDFIENLAKDFRVEGIIWYQLMYRESYDMQSFYFAKRVKDRLGIPILKLQSDYDTFETGQFRTRIHTFIEIAHK